MQMGTRRQSARKLSRNPDATVSPDGRRNFLIQSNGQTVHPHAKLYSSKQLDTARRTSHEVDVTTPAQSPPPQQLLDRDLFLRLMKRTGQGDEVDIRKLAARAGISRGVVGDLASGARSRVTYESAAAICAALGIDMPILFGTVGRSLTFVPEQPDEPNIAASA